jgi:hypothetical protein
MIGLLTLRPEDHLSDTDAERSENAYEYHRHVTDKKLHGVVLATCE